MGDKNNQIINGDSNNQTIINVNGDLVQGIDRQQVVDIIKSFCYVNRDDVIEIVKNAIESIDEKYRIMPDKRIFVPAIQRLAYSMDNVTVKNAYKNLLSSSMNKNKFMIMHPSYVDIISQLNSDEIKLLDTLIGSTHITYPLINMRLKTKNSNDLGIILLKYFTDIGYGVCDIPENITVYIENLIRLNLITIPYGQFLTDKQHYTKLENHDKVLNIKNDICNSGAKNIDFKFDHMVFGLTQFGYNFIAICR